MYVVVAFCEGCPSRRYDWKEQALWCELPLARIEKEMGEKSAKKSKLYLLFSNEKNGRAFYKLTCHINGRFFRFRMSRMVMKVDGHVMYETAVP